MKRLFLLSAILFVSLVLIETNAYAFTMHKISGDNQKGAAGSGLVYDLVVRVTRNGQPINTRSVTFSVVSGGGSVFTPSVTLDNNGYARGRVRLGMTRGEQRFRASLGSVTSVTFTATSLYPIHENIESATADEPDIYKKWKGESVSDSDTVPKMIDWSYAGYKQGSAIPETHNYPIINVQDHGAIPNDGLSDTEAIRSAISAASWRGTIIYFPAGKYDVLTDEEEIDYIYMANKSNIIFRGDGAGGSLRGGTTIRQHNSPDDYDKLYRLFFIEGQNWKPGEGSRSRVVGTFASGSKYFDVENADSLRNKKFVIVWAYGLKGDFFDEYSSRPVSDMHSVYDIKKDGINVSEIHEIDRVEGNRVYIKAPIITSLHSKFWAGPMNLVTNVGFEDMQIDGGFRGTFEHGEHFGWGGIFFKGVANCWIRRIRFTNTTNPIGFHSSAHCTAISIIVDGRSGHQIGNFAGTYNFIGLLECYTKGLKTHGVTTADESAGCVVWKAGGPTLRGPDGHGSRPRFTLFDNYYSYNHDSCSGVGEHQPHHLDVWTSWNNKTQDSNGWDLWTSSIWHTRITKGAIIGYIQSNTNESPEDAYVESLSNHVEPLSLYEAMLMRRLGYLPQWLDNVQEDHWLVFQNVIGKVYNAQPIFEVSGTHRKSLSSNAPRNTDFGSPIIAIDPEGTAITYTLVRDPNDNRDFPFSIDASTGQLRLTRNRLRSGTSYYFHVKATDANLQYSQLRIQVYVYKSKTEFVPLTDRTPQVRDELLAHVRRSQGDDTLTASDVTAEMLAALQWFHLDLRDQGITSLKLGDFNGLSACTSVDLQDNELPRLVHNVFEGLDQAIAINLQNNDIGSIYDSAFYNVPDLENINISNNRLRNMHQDIFLYNTKLREVLLHRNEPMNTVRKGWFNGKQRIRQLTLAKNSISRIEQGAFTDMPGLTMLNIRDNELQYVDELEGLTQLTRLWVSGNPIADHSPLVRLKSNNPNLRIDVDLSPYSAPQTITLGVDQTALLPNFPNPFNPETWIPYQLSKPANVSLTIYDPTGKVIRELNLGHQIPGRYIRRPQAIYWDGRNKLGERVASGIYFYRLKAGDFSATRKMLILK